jgi:hypothetical protein
MSHRFAAYFAIVGTLAFAPSSAANAGPFNMPHFNMAQPHFNMLRPQPHFNMLRPQISMHTPHLSNMPPPHPRPMPGTVRSLQGPTGQSETPQQSTTGTTSANLASNVSGANVSGANVSGGAAPSRFRVIEDGGRFAVVERRSDTVIKAGFESSKAAWAWIANHV